MIVEPGTRVEIVDFDPFPPGLQGTVSGVVLTPFTDGLQVWIDFDDGQYLCLTEGVDQWREVA